MTDSEESHTENHHEIPGQPQPFLALAEELVAEHGRLGELAETCRTYAEALSVREAELADRERWVSEARETFAQQVRELSQREEELGGKMVLVEEAERRLKDARQRETDLAALGAQLIERFGPPHQGL